MTWTDPHKWTCPSCQRTVVIDGTDDDVKCSIEACQVRHATEHRKAAVLLARLRKTNVDRPAPRWGQAS